MSIKIGELARLAGCKVVTVRYYEREGLLGAPGRSGGNYRLYGERDVERLKFIRHCRRHDMALEEIRKLLEYRDNPDRDCGWVSELLTAHIGDVESKIQSLSQLKGYLEGLRGSCEGGCSVNTCGIMRGLNDSNLCGCGNGAEQ